MSDLKLQGEVSLDVSQADQALGKVEQSAKQMATTVTKAGEQAQKAVGGIGADAGGAAQKVDNSTRSMIASVQRATAALEAGSKSGSKYFEVLAQQRGANLDALR